MCDYKGDSGLFMMFCFLVQVLITVVISLCESSSHCVLRICVLF